VVTSWKEIIKSNAGTHGSCGRKAYQPKTFWTAPSAGKHMATVLWNVEGILMVECLPQATTANSVIKCGILIHLCQKSQ
jgi:hypothetical protein